MAGDGLRRRGVRLGSVALAVVVFSSTAGAQNGLLTAIRGGVLYHDAPIVAEEVEDGVDVNLELRFRSPAALADIGSPEPVLGGTLNSEGDTSRVYAGLAWTADLSDSLFLSGVAGGAMHDGELHATEPGRKALGSRVLFHLALELGVRLDAHNDIAVYVDHMSNASLANENEGLDTIASATAIVFE